MADHIENVAKADHHVVGPKTYLIVFSCLLFFTGLTVAAAFVDLGEFNPVYCRSDRLHQGGARHPVLHAHLLQFAPDEADCSSGVLYLPGIDHDDLERLHKPGLGTLVALVSVPGTMPRTKAASRRLFHLANSLRSVEDFVPAMMSWAKVTADCRCHSASRIYYREAGSQRVFSYDIPKL